jgi:hypothetical protein
MGSGIWFDGDNQRMLVEDSFSGRNGIHGLYAEANGGPITIRRSKACENGVDGFMNSRSNKVTLEDNQIFHNKYWQIATTGSDTPLTITDWQTGQTYVANAYDWTITGNKVIGGPLAGPLPNGCHPGPCGWNFWLLSQYTAVAQTATMDYNWYYHTSATNTFRVPDANGRTVNFATWRTLMSAVEPNEAHSTWGDPGPLFCTP